MPVPDDLKVAFLEAVWRSVRDPPPGWAAFRAPAARVPRDHRMKLKWVIETGTA